MSRIVAAMSGGVDSSVAAALLAKERGDDEVVGVWMRTHGDLPEGYELSRSCCSPDAADDARRVAQILDIPFFVLNVEREFGARVIDAFVDASGAPAAVVAGVGALRGAGTAVLVGLGAESMELPTQLIQNRELVLTGVFRYANTWPEAIALVESGRVDLDGMITGRFPLERAAEALDSDRTPGSVKTVVAVS
jgi:threonine dehydrogenase-like Zn-dependent dehydrogenase